MSAGVTAFNRYGVWAIYRFEMARCVRTLLQSLVTPVITTSLYFVVFGSAIGSRMTRGGRRALRRLHRARPDHAVAVHASISNASFGIYFPKFTGTIYELLSAPISTFEMVARLRRRGGDQVDDPRAGHPRHRRVLRAGADRCTRSG